MFSRLFKSRWAALFWSAGIVWTAYDVAGAAPTPAPTATATTRTAGVDATGEAIDPADLAALAKASP